MSSLNRKDGKMSAKSSGAGKMHGPSFMIHNSNTIVLRKDPGKSARREDKKKKILVTESWNSTPLTSYGGKSVLQDPRTGCSIWMRSIPGKAAGLV
jgi:hypothetical protein